MNERSCPKAETPQLTTNEKIRKLAEANPDLADVLKSKFPEAFEGDYLEFEFDSFGKIPQLAVLNCFASDAGVKPKQGIFVTNDFEVITKTIPGTFGGTAVLFRIKK